MILLQKKNGFQNLFLKESTELSTEETTSINLIPIFDIQNYKKHFEFL